ncbi:MAG: ribosome assembly factor SBDS [DPANN group archaeon]|nr:ribosome assembly factor SBDS [DPANN group archaeon]
MSNGQTFDKERISLNIVRLKKAGKTFEINVDPDLAVQLKEGKDIEVRDILKAEKIFADVKKGLLASEHDLKLVFDTESILEAATIIIREGDIQLTQEYRQKLREEKLKRIMDIIHVNGVDPRTHAPHPLTRIENAFKEANIHIDEFEDIKQQVQDILKKLRVILPISFENRKLLIKIPAAYAPQCYAVVKNLSTIQKEEWQNDGSWHATIEIPAGLADDLLDKLNSMSHGDVATETLNNGR